MDRRDETSEIGPGLNTGSGRRSGHLKCQATTFGLLVLWGLGALGFPGPIHASYIRPAPEWSQVPALADTLTPWFAGFRYERELITSDLPHWADWSRVNVVLVRDLTDAAVGGEVFQEGRFHRVDIGFALDLYKQLWSGSYGNLRLRFTPGAEVLPRADFRLELFQALPGGWELSGSYWRMDFEDDDVDVMGAGFGRFVGNWYLRAVTTVGTLAGRSALSVSAMTRRYLGISREFVEVSGGVGREVVLLGAGPVVDVRETRFVQARVQKFLNHRWGLSAGIAFNRFEGAPQRRGVSLGLITRF